MAVLTPNRPLLIVLLPGLFLLSSCRTILSGYNVIPTAEITPKMQWALVVVYSRFKLGNATIVNYLVLLLFVTLWYRYLSSVNKLSSVNDLSSMCYCVRDLV